MNIYDQIIQAAQKAENIVITAHKSPDGDSIGSSLALYHYLKAKNKNVSICHPDPVPNYLSWLPEVDLVIDYGTNAKLVEEKLTQADLIFALDFNHPSRLGDMGQFLEGKKDIIAMIDHHLHPSDFAALQISDTNCGSTAQLIFELANHDDYFSIDALFGTPVYLGIMTDTGSFRFSSVTARTHEVLAEILNAGVQHSMIHEQIFDQNTLSQLQLKSYAIDQKLELLANNKAAILSLTAEELERYNYKKGDTEGIVNTALSIQGVKMAVFLVEKDGAIKLSFRSKHDVSVNVLANENFEGGGHAYASGGISYLSMNETLEKLKKLIPTYVE
jgi:phosphoesterase RecJ-like protein